MLVCVCVCATHPHLAGMVGTGCGAHFRPFSLLLFVDFQLFFVSALICVVVGYHGLSITFKGLAEAGSTPDASVIMCCQSLQLRNITEYNTAIWLCCYNVAGATITSTNATLLQLMIFLLLLVFSLVSL